MLIAQAINVDWKTWILGIVGIIITGYILPAVKDSFQSMAKAANATAGASEQSRKQILASRLKQFLYGTASSIATTEFPKLAALITSGQIKDPAKVKSIMYSWGDDLKKAAIAYFNTQDISLADEFGTEQLNGLIVRAANAVSPFPGKEVAVQLLEGGAKDILDKGVVALQSKIGPDKM